VKHEEWTLRGALIGLVVVSAPFAAIAWWRHGLLVGCILLVIPPGMYLAGKLHRWRFAADVFRPKTRLSGFWRFATIALGTAATTWCTVIVIAPGSVAADTVQAATTGSGACAAAWCLPLCLRRREDRVKERRSAAYRRTQKEIRAARRNGG